MKTQNAKFKKLIIALLIIEAFNGLSGLLGGVGLILDPTAATLGMDLNWLEGTPFKSYLIPGIVLFSVNGIGNTSGAIASGKKHKYSPEAGLILGMFMMLWIISQVAWIGYKSFLQPLYFSTGLIQVILSIFLLRIKKMKSVATS
jgi:hypothetical protein